MSSSVLEKRQFRDPAQRLFRLVDTLEPRFRRQFQNMLSLVKNDLTVARLTRLIETGQQQEAFNVIRAHVEQLASRYNAGYIEAGQDTAQVLSGYTRPLVVTFNVVNERAVRIMQNNQLNFVREFTREQTEATRQALIRGVREGLNPRAQARAFRDSIGLTSRQEAAVNNYSRLLRENNRQALERGLRDRRFDGTVRRAINNGKPLTDGQIDRMVGRYRERYLKYRSEVIARTEALQAAHEGTEEMFNQAIENGNIRADQLQARWHTRQDGRQRDSHDAMAGQTRPHGEPFVSGEGNLIRYPGDPQAPAEERIQCRCAVSRTIKDEN
jgi:hypothetical protein